MKFKYLKSLSILIIGLIVFNIGNDFVRAAELTKGASIKLDDLSFYMPYKTVDGKEAYCAYFRKEAYHGGTLNEIDVSQSEQIGEQTSAGIATIIESTVPGYSGKAAYAIKEVAINLYLSVMEGHYDRFKNLASNTPKTPEEFQNSSKKGNRAVYDLYVKAMNASQNSSSVTPWIHISSGSFSLSGDNYKASFDISFSSNVNSSSIYHSSSMGTTYTNGNSIIVTIAKDEYEEYLKQEDSEGITVYVSATAYKRRYKLRRFDADTSTYQPYIVAEPSIETYHISDSVSTKPVLKTCYKYNISCNNTSCQNTNASNTTTCNSYVTTEEAYECDDDVNQYGKKIADGVYCTEVAYIYYPGNVSPAITIGTNLSWPTSSSDGKNNIYPLTTRSTLKCNISNVRYWGASGNGTLTYNDTMEYHTIGLQKNCKSRSENGNTVYECEYTLPKGNYVTINKTNANFIRNIPDVYTNYILITKYRGVLPIGGYKWSFDSKAFDKAIFNNNYELTISGIPLGYGGQFTRALNNSYTCHYNVTADASGECNCPPGTEHSGKDLAGGMGNDPTIESCADAQEKYCNTNVPNIDSNYLCPSYTAYPNRSYKACVTGGKTEAECIAEICYEKDLYKCPRGTDYEGMDITSCVYTKRSQGFDLNDSIESCEKLCNKGGEIVIYRTISLENPFPSIDADYKITQNGLKIGDFNDTILGRYPGTNWNSVTLVHNKILNNRGYDGSAIYQEAKPLYTINLDAKAIKDIRQYNKKQENEGGYADFNLSCTDGAYCISKFLHNNNITTATGESILDAQNSTCASATNKSSFISCYKYK